MSRQSIEEQRDNADVICLQMLQYLQDSKNFDGFSR